MPYRPRVLIVDDKESMAAMLAKLLQQDYDVQTASCGEEAIEIFEGRPADAVLTDIRMPDMDGLQVLRRVKQKDPAVEVILMTAYATVTQAVEAVKAGAYHYLTKPFEPDELQLVLAKALERRQLKEETRILKEQVNREQGFPNIIGNSEAMRRAYALARKAAESDTTVMLTGESGTGKEVFARAIHVASERSGNRFVAVNCGAMPKELIESELFGHVKGAFSGAVKDKKGLFMEASGGTILLDEVTELDPELQVKINRVIQEREIRRVGDTRDVSVDVRIIAASNRDLLEAVEEGYFREDLYYRLNVFPIQLPPLRRREGDVPMLVNHFLDRMANGGEPFAVDAGAMEALINYHWPGNVRQLQNAVERAVVLCEDRHITADLFNFIDAGKSDTAAEVGELANLEYREAMDRASERFQKRYLSELLKRTGGNVTRAAEHAGIERESFHRLMRKVGVDADEIRQQSD